MQNAELFTLTYGSVVVQLIKDYEDYAEVNKQLEKMYVYPWTLTSTTGRTKRAELTVNAAQTKKKRGYNIGVRLIEDFLAKSGTGKCADFRETAEVISKVPSSPAPHPIPPK